MWTETKTNYQFSSTGWIIKSSQIVCLRKDACSKPKPWKNCIGQLDRGQSAVIYLLITPMTSFKTSLRNTGWATQYLSDVWLSTNGVIRCESYNLQAGVKSPLMGARRRLCVSLPSGLVILMIWPPCTSRSWLLYLTVSYRFVLQAVHCRQPSFSGCCCPDLEHSARQRSFGINCSVLPA